MNFKKIVTTMIACTLVLSPISSYAINDNNAESGSVNVDYLLKRAQHSSTVSMMYQSSSTISEEVQNVGGGTFTVRWFEKEAYGRNHLAFSSKYEHPTKIHRASVTGVEYVTSDWVHGGVVAYAWTYSKSSGNRANWDVK